MWWSSFPRSRRKGDRTEFRRRADGRGGTTASPSVRPTAAPSIASWVQRLGAAAAAGAVPGRPDDCHRGQHEGQQREVRRPGVHRAGRLTAPDGIGPLASPSSAPGSDAMRNRELTYADDTPSTAPDADEPTALDAGRFLAAL